MSQDSPPLSGGEQLVAAGDTVVRVTHESMMAVSVQRKRDLDAVLESVITEIDRVPQWAVRGFYRRPVGGGVTATGPSVYLARMLARNFGNCSIRSYLQGQTEELFQIAGVFLDLQTNFLCERVFPVARTAWRSGRGGGKGYYVELEGEKLTNAILIGASKAERNAISEGVPDWLMQAAFQKCQQLAADDTKGKLGDIVQWFAVKGVTRERLERHFDKGLEHLDAEQLADLRGLANALRDGEIDVAEIGAEAEGDKGAAEQASVDDVVGGETEVTRGAAAPDPQAAAEPAESSPPEGGEVVELPLAGKGRADPPAADDEDPGF